MRIPHRTITTFRCSQTMYTNYRQGGSTFPGKSYQTLCFHYHIKPSQGGIIKRFMNGRKRDNSTQKGTESSAVVRVISFTVSANYVGMGWINAFTRSHGLDWECSETADLGSRYLCCLWINLRVLVMSRFLEGGCVIKL